ncbi:MAG: hypothetical protein AABX82_00990, partial [Nanoarchaeota archaeon]
MPKRLTFAETLDAFDRLFMTSDVTQDYETLASNLREWNPATLQELLEKEERIKELLVQGKSFSIYESFIAQLKDNAEGRKIYQSAIKNYQQVKENMPEIEERIMLYIEKGWDEETKKEAPNRDAMQQIAQFWKNMREIVGEKTESKEGQEIEEWKEGDQKIEALLREAENICGQYKQNENWSWREQDVTAFMDEMEVTMGRTYDTILHAVKGKNLYEQTEKERLARIGEIRREMQEERAVYGVVRNTLEQITRQEEEMTREILSMNQMIKKVTNRKGIGYNAQQIGEITRTLEGVSES